MDTWQVKQNSLYRKFEFKDFVHAFSFMAAVALEAEKAQHHPLWTNEYNVVEIWLTSHDEGNIVTDKDKTLSEKIDKLFE